MASKYAFYEIADDGIELGRPDPFLGDGVPSVLQYCSILFNYLMKISEKDYFE